MKVVENRRILKNGKIFEKVGVNVSDSIWKIFKRNEIKKFLGAEKNGNILGFWNFSSYAYEKS